MSQVKIPADFALQVSLLNSIIEKNESMGSESPLAAWLIQQQTNLAADQEAGEQATEQEALRAAQEAKSKIAFASRNGRFAPVIAFIRGGAQVLKKFYKPNYANLTEWAIPVTDSGRIAYPSSFEEQNAIATSFFTKLASFDEGKSPLAAFIKTNSSNVPDLSKNNTAALTDNSVAGKTAKAAENATEKRDGLWAIPLKHIHDIADYLKSIYSANPRELGEWGYVVDESEQKSVLRKSKLGLGEIRTVTSVVLNSILTNTGKVIIVVFKGKGMAGTATTLKPGERIGILKGYSTITVQNTSTLEMAEYTIEILR